MKHFVTATFETHMAAENALQNLENAGIDDSQVSVVVTDEARGGFNIETHSRADEGVAGGATAGGIVGAVLGSLLAAGTIAVPGLNLVVTGALAGALAGLATGATAGGLLGGLIGAGISEHEAKIYEEDIKNGAILIAVKTQDEAQRKRVKNILEQANPYHLAA
jgi:hypothetical protein